MHCKLAYPGVGWRAAPRTYLVRSAAGWRPRPDGESAGATGPSGDCSGRGDGRGGASSAGGAGGCMAGGAQDAFRPAEEPLRATHDVSMTLTPMLAGDTETPRLSSAPTAPGSCPHEAASSAAPSICWTKEARRRPCSAERPAAPGWGGLGTASLRTAACPTSSPEPKLPSEQRAASLGGRHPLLPSGGWRRGGEGEGGGQHQTRREHRPAGTPEHPSFFLSPGGPGAQDQLRTLGPAPGRWLAYNLCKVYRAGRADHALVSPHPQFHFKKGDTALSTSAKATRHAHSPLQSSLRHRSLFPRTARGLMATRGYCTFGFS